MSEPWEVTAFAAGEAENEAAAELRAAVAVDAALGAEVERAGAALKRIGDCLEHEPLPPGYHVAAARPIRGPWEEPTRESRRVSMAWAAALVAAAAAVVAVGVQLIGPPAPEGGPTMVMVQPPPATADSDSVTIHPGPPPDAAVGAGPSETDAAPPDAAVGAGPSEADAAPPDTAVEEVGFVVKVTPLNALVRASEGVLTRAEDEAEAATYRLSGVPAGRRVTLSVSAKGYRTVDRTVVLDDAPQVVSFRLGPNPEYGTLRVNVKPWGKCRVGREPPRHTPFTVRLKAGRHKVVCTYGTRKKTRTVRVRPNQQSSVLIVL